jgi:hypothetical protein
VHGGSRSAQPDGAARTAKVPRISFAIAVEAAIGRPGFATYPKLVTRGADASLDPHLGIDVAVSVRQDRQ